MQGKWHPVISKMNKGAARLPYEVKYMYNYNDKREYGLPIGRKK